MKITIEYHIPDNGKCYGCDFFTHCEPEMDIGPGFPVPYCKRFKKDVVGDAYACPQCENYKFKQGMCINCGKLICYSKEFPRTSCILSPCKGKIKWYEV